MSKWVIATAGIVVIVVVWMVLGSKPADQPAPSGLTPVASFTHAHGLAVDPIDSSKLYIATHHGLYLLKDDKSLFRIGDKQDDYMGFSLHPTDSSIFFTSGHPMFGGNLGFQKSQDGGKTWQKLSDGLNGPVDFHAMSVSPTDPNLIAGWYQGLQISSDGGQNWRMQAGSPDQIISLAFDSKLRERLYAATPHGLMVSDDLGDTWRSLNDDGVAVSVAVSPANNQKLLSSLQSSGLMQSTDAGKTWNQLSAPFGDDIVLYVAFAKAEAAKIYVLTQSNTLYKSEDSGARWTKVR